MTPADELQPRLADFLMADAGERSPASKRLVTCLRAAIASGSDGEARAALKSALQPTLDYTTARALLGVFRRLPRSDATARVRVAVLGSSSTGPLTEILELYLFSRGVEAELYEADYGVFRQELLDPSSGLYEFAPEVVFLATGTPDLAQRPELGCDEQQLERLVTAEAAGWRELWDVLRSRVTCQIIQNNFVREPQRQLGNHEGAVLGSLGSFVARLNQVFAQTHDDGVTIHDLDHLASCAGLWAWSDPRFYHHAKLPCAPEQLVQYADSVASLIAAQRGLSRKCLVLDLDDTLWGGVIGDDGLEGIQIGQGDGASEAFTAFQRYVKSLGERGVILAVCSANEEATARAVFEQHPEMVLRLPDIACFVANWNDKASNLREIAAQLNIGLDALVFVDDNPAQRALVRSQAPEVAVPELPADPSDYIRALERHRYFESTSLGSEDLRRTELYRANAQREQAQAQAGGLEDYLATLQMRGRVESIHGLTLARSAQLINKTNQFNLTTRRRTAAELEALVKSPDWITLTLSLSDRFGDTGLISVVLAHLAERSLVIDTWVMSCRVLRRGVERQLMNQLHRAAQELGVERLCGEFIPSPKNALVASHYADLGFSEVSGAAGATTQWELALSGDWAPLNTYIETTESNEFTPI